MDCSPGAVNIAIALRDELVKAAKRIQQLEAQNAELLKKVEQLQAERDAAVADMTSMAEYVLDTVCEWCDQTECESDCAGTGSNRGFKWRGVQKEE